MVLVVVEVMEKLLHCGHYIKVTLKLHRNDYRLGARWLSHLDYITLHSIFRQ
jgi:hypothetical protein